MLCCEGGKRSSLRSRPVAVSCGCGSSGGWLGKPVGSPGLLATLPIGRAAMAMGICKPMGRPVMFIGLNPGGGWDK